MKILLAVVLIVLAGWLCWWLFLRPKNSLNPWQRAQALRQQMQAIPKEDRLLKLLKMGVIASEQRNPFDQKEILQAIGELGTDASVPFIEDYLSTTSLEMMWSDLLKGIVEGAENAEPQWKARVFEALEKGIADPSPRNRFKDWPFVSWPAAMMAVDPKRAVKAFADRSLLVLGAPGFTAAVTAINSSTSADAVVPAEVAARWLPTANPSFNDPVVGEQYVLMLRAHAEVDLPEAKRRLWEVVHSGGPHFGAQAASLLLRVEGLPDPVWKLDARVQDVGLDKVNPAERTVWTVANGFTFPLATYGGFDRFVVMGAADNLPEVVPELKAIGAPVTAGCLQQWIALFGSTWPEDQDDRAAMIHDQDLKPGEHWEAICAATQGMENVGTAATALSASSCGSV